MNDTSPSSVNKVKFITGSFLMWIIYSHQSFVSHTLKSDEIIPFHSLGKCIHALRKTGKLLHHAAIFQLQWNENGFFEHINVWKFVSWKMYVYVANYGTFQIMKKYKNIVKEDLKLTRGRKAWRIFSGRAFALVIFWAESRQGTIMVKKWIFFFLNWLSSK